jgi:hypothetical protein
MRFILILFLMLAICYVLLMGVPETPSDIKWVGFYDAMRVEITDMIDHFTLMHNLAVKLTLIGGIALLFVTFFNKLSKA